MFKAIWELLSVAFLITGLASITYLFTVHHICSIDTHDSDEVAQCASQIVLYDYKKFIEGL